MNYVDEKPSSTHNKGELYRVYMEQNDGDNHRVSLYYPQTDTYSLS